MVNMKSMKCLILLISFAAYGYVSAQINCLATVAEFDFDSNPPLGYILEIDTINYPGNKWQIGPPLKPIINSANSSPNVIITDTASSYTTNDTSVFYTKYADFGGFAYGHTAEIAGYYNVNSDSLNDYGMIEISLDQGTTWIDIISDPSYSPYIDWYSSVPVLTGNSDGWQFFHVQLAQLSSLYSVNSGDTIITKYTFISDGIIESMDGLAFDNLQSCNYVEGIEELINESKELVKVCDYLGRETSIKKNTPLLFYYANGKIERKIIVEE